MKVKKIFIVLLACLMAFSLFACVKDKTGGGGNETPIEPVTKWPLSGLMLSSKQASRRLATVDVTPMVTNWEDVEYFAIQVYQPSPYAWAFQLALNTPTGMTKLNEDAPVDSTDFTNNYNMAGNKMWDLQVYYGSAFTIPAAIVNGGAHWIVLSRDVLGLNAEGITSSMVDTIVMRLDISDYNTGIQIVFGKMMIFTEEINDTFSNGITVFDSSSYDDDTFWSMYTLQTYTSELHDNFDEFMNRTRIKEGTEIGS